MPSIDFKDDNEYQTTLIDDQDLKLSFQIDEESKTRKPPEPTTITAVVTLEGYVFYQLAFPLLQISKFINGLPKLINKGKNKLILPTTEPAGSIISARYKEITRGIICTKTRKTFENSITIDLSLGTKNINMKLSSTKIQMCGAKSREMISDAVNYIIGNLSQVQSLLDWINDYPEKALITKTWVLNKVKKMVIFGGKKMEIKYEVHKISMPEEYPEGIYPKLANYLIEQSTEYRDFFLYEKHLEWMFSLKKIIINPLRPLRLRTEMVNINYNLNFRVRLAALCRIIEMLKLPCRARYNPLYDKFVTITFPCYYTNNDDNKPVYGVLLAYSTGCITQSCRTPEISDEIFHSWTYIIDQIRPQIDYAELVR